MGLDINIKKAKKNSPKYIKKTNPKSEIPIMLSILAVLSFENSSLSSFASTAKQVMTSAITPKISPMPVMIFIIEKTSCPTLSCLRL